MGHDFIIGNNGQLAKLDLAALFNVQGDVVLVRNMLLSDSESLSVLRYAGDDLTMNWNF